MNKMIQASETLLVDTGNIIKCKQLTKKVFDSIADEMVESVRHCLASLAQSSANAHSKAEVEYTHENHSSVVSPDDVKRVRIVVKVFLSPREDNALSQAVRKAISHLGVSRIDLLVVAFPQPVGGHKLELHHMQPAWRVCESLVAEGLVASVGVSDLDMTQLRELHQWAPFVKPSTNQLHYESAVALSADMTEFAAENNIQLLSHADDIATTGAGTVRKMLAEYKEDADDWACAWVTRYTVAFHCRGVLYSKGYIVKLSREQVVNDKRPPTA